MWKVISALIVIALVSALVGAEIKIGETMDKFKDSAEQATTIEKGNKYCPFFPGGKACPSSNIFYTYQCCGFLNKDCCFKMQTWVYVVLGVIGLIIVLALLISFLRYLFGRH